MVERDEASPKLGIPNPSRSGNRILEAEPAARNNRNQGKCPGKKSGHFIARDLEVTVHLVEVWQRMYERIAS